MLDWIKQATDFSDGKSKRQTCMAFLKSFCYEEKKQDETSQAVTETLGENSDYIPENELSDSDDDMNLGKDTMYKEDKIHSQLGCSVDENRDSEC